VTSDLIVPYRIRTQTPLSHRYPSPGDGGVHGRPPDPEDVGDGDVPGVPGFDEGLVLEPGVVDGVEGDDGVG
jgi:hypothetical protein